MADPKTAAMPTEDQVAELKELRARGRKSWNAWKAHAEQAKSHKADWEETNIKIGELIDEIDNPTPKLPFGKDEPVGHGINPDMPALPDRIGLRYDPDTDDRWRAVSVAELGLSQAIIEKLNQADIFTVGHLADRTADGTPLTSIKGVGKTAEDKIVAALSRFWETAAERFPADEDDDEAGALDDESDMIGDDDEAA